MFTRTESFQQFIRLYPVVCILLALNILLFLLTFLPFFPEYLLLERWSGYNRFIAAGEWWRLVTSIFLHRSFSHLLFNCFSIIILAPALEKMLGRIRFCFFFLIAGIIANIATYLLTPPAFSHVGASNAILGVLGFYVYLAAFHKQMMSRQHAMTIYALTAVSVFMTFMQPETNHIGHLSGLAAGVVLAPLFRKKLSLF
ncbi:rhomboid family intramembrane serine protease [Peribacillus cavernae]|uniref:Rhomboid family intramembrane serine protease n=1 Tax=Peribacillus cavernae TaxID=1674310 RepID=A0A3S0TXJ6_9BACI|nr:rhomboid family intramembrane serine protease [Peribacillus cavernae]MDQ0221330.1 membrane associated rhomboid family serine protease [Peribacillus cavernae]RUQ26975.1 rhomboid family intramembrane serine protease [Peribacillus cavernae]